MSLIKCAECGREISEVATSCPHCGYPLKRESMMTNLPQESASKKVIGSKLLVAVVVLVVSGIAIGLTILSQIKSAARKQYIENLTDISALMLSGAVEAEETCGLIHDVWYDTIHKKGTQSTFKYVIQPSKYNENIFSYLDSAYNDDFNDSLRQLFSSEEYITSAKIIRATSSEVAGLYRQMQTVPAGLESCGDALDKLYDTYLTLDSYATNPNGSLASYTTAFNAADTNFLNAYNKLKSIVPIE